MSGTRVKHLAVAVGLTLALVACGGGDDESADATTTTEATTTEAETTEPAETTTTEAPETTEATETTEPGISSMDDFGDDISDEGESYDEYVEITDDSGVLVVEVPVEWSDVDGGATANGDPSLQAAPDLSGDVSTTPVLGFTAVEYTTLPDLDNVIAQTAAATTGGQCDEQLPGDYADGAFSGRVQTFTGCGGQDRAWLFVAATPDNGDPYVTVIFGNAVTVADVEAIERAFDTFNTTI